MNLSCLAEGLGYPLGSALILNISGYADLIFLKCHYLRHRRSTYRTILIIRFIDRIEEMFGTLDTYVEICLVQSIRI